MVEIRQETLQKMFYELQEYEVMETERKFSFMAQLLDQEQKDLIREKKKKMWMQNAAVKRLEKTNNTLRIELKRQSNRNEKVRLKMKKKNIGLAKSIKKCRKNIDYLLNIDIYRLKSHRNTKLPPSITESQILNEIIQNHNIPMELLIKGPNEKRINEARADAILKLRDVGFTYSRIGNIFNKNHASIIYIYKKYKGNYTETVKNVE